MVPGEDPVCYHVRRKVRNGVMVNPGWHTRFLTLPVRTLPRSTRHVGAWIEKEFGLVYESRLGLITLLHRLGLEYHKPNVIPRKLNEEKQKAFISSYEYLLNSLGDDEAVMFADAVHPTNAARRG